MRTVGIDLAAEPGNTGIAVIEWQAQSARVVTADVPGSDDAVLRHAQDADKVGIDCPLGWPDTFGEFLDAQHKHNLQIPDLMSSADWRRSLSYRATDEYARKTLEIIPLSVSADRIGITAMRAARLQVLLAAAGHTIDRAGSGLVVEVYPAAGLKLWGLRHRGYKGPTRQGGGAGPHRPASGQPARPGPARGLDRHPDLHSRPPRGVSVRSVAATVGVER